MTEMLVSPAGALMALDLWRADDDAAASGALGVAMPGPGRAAVGWAGTIMRVGPRRWWLDLAEFAQATLNGSGVVTAIGGGWTRVRLDGAGWRDLIMQCGLIDAEHSDFGPGSVVTTLLCHVRCVLHVRAATQCDVFVPASYTEHCLSQWRTLGWRQVCP